MTKLKVRIKNPATISVPLDQCLNCGQHINQIQDGLHNVDSPKSSTAVVAFDSFVQNSRTQVFMRDALKEIYSLLYLVQLNKDSDGSALCVDCCLVFAQLYGLFHTFESRRKSDGFLGSTLKLAFKSVAAGSWTLANGAAQEIDSDEDRAGHQAAMETDPLDSLIEIQGFSSEETSDGDVSEDDDDDVEMPQTFESPPSPDSASDQDVEMPEDLNSSPASPVDLDPASPINSSPASPINSSPASPVGSDTASQVKSEPDPEQLNPLESPVSPPASPGAPKNLKPKPVLMFKCIDCAKPFQSATELGTHRVEAHKAEYPFACHLCPYKTKTSSILKPHVARHSAPWNLKCKICKRLFRLKNDLRHHLRRAHKLTNFITEHYMEGETPVPNRIRKSSARGQINDAVACPKEDVVAGTSQDVKSEDKSKKSKESSKKSAESSKKCDENSRNPDDSDSDEDPKSKGSSELQVDAAANEDKSNSDSDSSSSSSYAPSGASNASSDSENDDEESPKKSKSKPAKTPNKSAQVTYKCTDCPEEFTSASVFGQHREKIHEKSGSEIYKCHCHFKLFERPSSLTLHLTRQAKSEALHLENQDEDTSNFIFQCVDCSEKFKSPAALGRHRKDVHKSPHLYVCHFCHYTTTLQSYLKPHVLRHIVTASLKCPKCDKYFKLKADVACHMRKTHKIRRIAQRSIRNEPDKPTVMISLCRKCDQEFDTQQDLIQHRKIAHGDNEAFHCDICQALFFSKSNLSTHRLRHASTPKFKCAHCDKTFHESSARNTHQKSMHALKIASKKAAFQCPKCRASFGSLEGVQAHNEAKHMGNKRVGTFTCDQCGKQFETKNKLQAHWHSIHKPIQCPHCDLKVDSRELTVHIKAKHPEKYGPYSKKKAQQSSETPPKDVQLHCCDCAAVFPTSFSFRHHRQVEHETPEDQILKCHLCNLVYRQETGFMLHVGGHNESSDWPCAHCPMRFTQRCHRNRHHVRDHGIEDDKDAMFPLPPGQTLECLQGQSSSGAPEGSRELRGRPRDVNDLKPFKCLDCDAQFERAKQLGIHRTIGHDCKNEERYQCHVCHQFYKTDNGLYNHMSRHSERVKLCENCGKGFKTGSDLMQHYQLNHTEDAQKHLREKWKRWRDKKSLETRTKTTRRRVDKSDDGSDSDE